VCELENREEGSRDCFGGVAVCRGEAIFGVFEAFSLEVGFGGGGEVSSLLLGSMVDLVLKLKGISLNLVISQIEATLALAGWLASMGA